MPEVFFNGPAGRIEGKFAESTNPKAPIALVLHPHPKFGGTMNNKVVYNVYKTLFEHDFTVLRINFRGVGRSLGEYDDGIGEMTDAATALDWLQINYPMSKLNMIAGFSFGAWIAMQLIMRRPEITNFLAISPPVNKYDFSFLSPCPIPGLIIQGDKDSVVSEDSVSELANRLSKQKNIDVNYRVIAGADHFFRDKIELLNEEIRDYLKLAFLHQIGKTTVKNDLTDKLSHSSPKKVFLD
ncbi:Alpha/beta hydrolase family protein [Candidatus Megaera venefica]|uniref:Alpha/beta hydrolase family protein n=1 Tax=Candidatus Megaera venefica TaxID=2055910 RepID=A0ABU5ND82_9RICK|nr:alpha/beta hydrolase [Candidatus Megaera venefica]MEA0971110.1 Alpha/beta hydrolase family protein [Candidatus Megaera venefica]